MNFGGIDSEQLNLEIFAKAFSLLSIASRNWMFYIKTQVLRASVAVTMNSCLEKRKGEMD